MNEIERLISLSGKTAKELAPILKTSESRLSEYKNNKRSISLRKLKEWCVILNLELTISKRNE